MKRIAAVSSLLLALACSSAAPPSASSPAAAEASYGMSSATAIEVCKPAGERKYVQRLRCADGSAPEFSRAGSGGMRTPATTEEEQKKAMDQMFGTIKPGDPDYHVIDYYEVRCGDKTTTLILDMYHCEQPEPTQAPAGFTIVP